KTGEKPETALCLIGAMGTGKTVFVDMLEEIVGHDFSYRTGDMRELRSQYTDTLSVPYTFPPTSCGVRNPEQAKSVFGTALTGTAELPRMPVLEPRFFPYATKSVPKSMSGTASRGPQDFLRTTTVKRSRTDEVCGWGSGRRNADPAGGGWRQKSTPSAFGGLESAPPSFHQMKLVVGA
ncbi:MAG: hypothetical protein LBH75_07375, partial [Treponema sp.]|nr:hypothetical protein [Treponema sp.]